MAGPNEFGNLLCKWREHRRLSQLTLANNAEISTKHLSFLERGRAAPSREMIVRLGEGLQIPLRQRNVLLTVGGYAEIYAERMLSDPGLQLVHEVNRTVLKGHEPNPAMALDYNWNIVAMNRSMQMLVGDVALTLLEPPMNAMRLALHPDGLAPRILNLSAWRKHAIALIKRRAALSADEYLIAFSTKCKAIPTRTHIRHRWQNGSEDFAIPLRLATAKGAISLVAATLAFGLPSDVTVSELTIEFFSPQTKTRSASSVTYPIYIILNRRAGMRVQRCAHPFIPQWSSFFDRNRREAGQGTLGHYWKWCAGPRAQMANPSELPMYKYQKRGSSHSWCNNIR